MAIALIRIFRNVHKINAITIASLRQSSDMGKFREELKKAKNVVILTGAGVSAESGIPTFRGAGEYWRKYKSASLATSEAFHSSPSLVWEFYHQRREAAAKAQPNEAHKAIAEFANGSKSDKNVTLITQNVDNLHSRAGSKNMIELHGNVFKTRCTKCERVNINHNSPICEGLANRGAPDINLDGSDIPKNSLPHCEQPRCGGLLRPHIVWFGENVETSVLDMANAVMQTCEVCLVVGTSSAVYPAAMFAPEAAARGAIVAEFNLEPTPATLDFQYYFQGPCGTTVPQALAIEN